MIIKITKVIKIYSLLTTCYVQGTVVNALHIAVLSLVAQSCLTLYNPMNCSLPGSTAPGDSPGKNTEAVCHVLLQGIFPTQGSNPGLPHCRRILYCLSNQGSPTRAPTKCILNCVANNKDTIFVASNSSYKYVLSNIILKILS